MGITVTLPWEAQTPASSQASPEALQTQTKQVSAGRKVQSFMAWPSKRDSRFQIRSCGTISSPLLLFLCTSIFSFWNAAVRMWGTPWLCCIWYLLARSTLAAAVRPLPCTGELGPEDQELWNISRNYITFPFDLCFMFVYLHQAHIFIPFKFPWDAQVSN